MSDSDQVEKALPSLSEIGQTGLKVYSGIVDEEFLRQLKGTRGVKTYQEMSENDATIAAIIAAIDLLVRAVEWTATPVDDSDEALEAAQFADSLFNDMSHTFEDFVSEVLSMLVFGWSYFEIVLKRRLGPDQKDGSRRSKYTDGKIGIRKLAIRSQDTMTRWQMQDDGGIAGMWQLPEYSGGEVFLPIDRCLLFRTKVFKGNPEGKSILRQAYRAWYMLRTIQNAESIGIERELAGLPVAYIPAEKMKTTGTAQDTAFYAMVKKMVRDVKFNEQGGVVLPSNTWPDAEGTPTSQPLVKFDLLSSGGTRSIDTSTVIKRYQQDIARSVLADFMMLGSDGKGSYALSKNKTDLFLRSCETYVERIASVINRFLLPRIWDYNGFNRDLMPKYTPGAVAPTDLGELGSFIDSLSRAGMPLFPDENLESHLRGEAGLPDKQAEDL